VAPGTIRSPAACAVAGDTAGGGHSARPGAVLHPPTSCNSRAVLVVSGEEAERIVEVTALDFVELTGFWSFACGSSSERSLVAGSGGSRAGLCPAPCSALCFAPCCSPRWPVARIPVLPTLLLSTPPWLPRTPGARYGVSPAEIAFPPKQRRISAIPEQRRSPPHHVARLRLETNSRTTPAGQDPAPRASPAPPAATGRIPGGVRGLRESPAIPFTWQLPLADAPQRSSHADRDQNLRQLPVRAADLFRGGRTLQPNSS